MLAVKRVGMVLDEDMLGLRQRVVQVASKALLPSEPGGDEGRIMAEMRLVTCDRVGEVYVAAQENARRDRAAEQALLQKLRNAGSVLLMVAMARARRPPAIGGRRCDAAARGYDLELTSACIPIFSRQAVRTSDYSGDRKADGGAELCASRRAREVVAGRS